jgi:flagellar hook-length control protein FliK
MMQQIATAKSELAAFTKGASDSPIAAPLATPYANEQFGKLLQEHQTHRQPSKSESANTTIRAPEIDQTVETEKTSTVEDNIQENNTNEVNSSPGNKNKPNDQVDSENTVENKTSQNAENNEPTEAEGTNTSDAPLNLAKQKGTTDDETSKHNIVSEDWVLLVSNLQKLASESSTTGETEEKLLTELVNQQGLDGNLVTAEQLILPTNTPISPVTQSSIEAEVKQSFSELVQQAINAAKHSGEQDHIDVNQKATEILLEKPQALQNILDKMNANSQENGEQTFNFQADKKTVKDNLITKELLKIPAQGHTPAPVPVIAPATVPVTVNLALNENKSLLSTLLSEALPNQDKSLDLKNIPLTKVPQVAVNSDAAVLAQTPTTILQSALLSENLEIEHELQTPVNLPAVVLGKTSKNTDVKTLLGLTENKLTKVLDNIAQRILDTSVSDTKVAADSITPEQSLALEQTVQQAVNPKMIDMAVSVESASKDFVSKLKSGLEEFRQQLSQGREPGIDLKALISDALVKTAEPTLSAKAPVNLENVVSSISQVLDVAHSISRSIEHHQEQSTISVMRDVAQIQGEQSKQIQLNQFESKLEKAINIAKPEGHQQLAEKVRWMVNTRNLVADIRLDPAELGSVHVRVAVTGESATVNFVVQSHQARDAVDTATPRLRELLAEKGIELGQSTVRQESEGRQEHNDGQLSQNNRQGGDGVDDSDVPEQIVAQHNVVNGALGGIDYFV